MQQKNKYYNRSLIDRSLINSIVYNYLSVRKKTSRIIPLTTREEFLISHFNSHKERVDLIEDDMFMNLKEIYLVNYVEKTNGSKFSNSIINMILNNPLRGKIPRIININEIKDIVKKATFSLDSVSWSRVCTISPSLDTLFDVSNFIEILIFNASSDMLGIVFKIDLTSNQQETLQRHFKEEFESETRYYNFGNWKKINIGLIYDNPNELRNRYYDNCIVEIKRVFTKFFINQLPLCFSFDEKTPISVNVYQTNYKFPNEVEKIESRFLRTQRLMDIYQSEKFEDEIYVFESNNQNIITTQMWFSKSVNIEHVDRSTNLFYFVDNSSQEVVTMIEEMLPIVNFMTLFNISFDLASSTLVERRNLFSNSLFKKLRLSSRYYSLNRRFQHYLQIFSELQIRKYCKGQLFSEEELQFLIEDYKEKIDLLKQTNEEYKLRMENNNSRSAFWFSVCSMILALLAIFQSAIN